MHQWTEDEQLNVPMKEVWCYLDVVKMECGVKKKKGYYFELIRYVF